MKKHAKYYYNKEKLIRFLELIYFQMNIKTNISCEMT